jgi:hypothetical protein
MTGRNGWIFIRMKRDFSELAGREIWQIVSTAAGAAVRATSHAPVSYSSGAANSHQDFRPVPPENTVQRGDFLDFLFMYVLYSTLLHMPPLRLHCVRGCWDRTQEVAPSA